MSNYLVVAFLAVAGCANDGRTAMHGDDAQAPARDGATITGPGEAFRALSGTRIKMRVATTPDGAKEFIGWFDTQKNADCRFMRTSDGKDRCVSFPPGRLASISTQTFADAACTRPLAQDTTCDGARPTDAPAALLGTRTICTAVYPFTDYRQLVFQVGPEHTGATIYSKANASSPCNAVDRTQAFFANYRFYEAGAEISLTEFVERTIAVE